MTYSFSTLKNYRTYSIELRKRNYPTFEGKYNAYVACYGQLSGQYLGLIELPIKTNITENDLPEILLGAENFISDNSHVPCSIW